MPQYQVNGPYGNGAQEDTVGAGFGGIAGALPGANVFAPGFEALMAAQSREQTLQQMGNNALQLQTPTFGSDAGVNAQYSGNFNPTMYQTPENAQATLGQDSAEGRAAQLAALQQMAGLTDQSAASSSALGRNQNEMDARQLAQSREGAVRQDAMRRGQVGGAADMIARQQAAQAAANQNLNAGLQNAQQAALMRLAGTQAGSQMAGQMRGQDQSMALANANILNQFNMANTQARNAVNQQNTQLRNAGNLRNLDATQNFMNNGTNLALAKLNRNDTNAQRGFGNQMTQYGAVNDVLNARLGNSTESNKEGLEAGKQGWSNFKDLAKGFGGGM